MNEFGVEMKERRGQTSLLRLSVRCLLSRLRCFRTVLMGEGRKQVPVTRTTLSFRLSCIIRYSRSRDKMQVFMRFEVIIRVCDEVESKGVRVS